MKTSFSPSILLFAALLTFPQLALTQEDPKSFKAEIDSLQIPEVEWRKIDWKTCLLDALKASREEKKPLIVWVFIDRPIDDKRC